MTTTQSSKSAIASHLFSWSHVSLSNKSEGFSPIDDLKVANSIPLKSEGFKDWKSQVVISNATKIELFENSVLRNFRTTATDGKQLYLSDHEALREAKQ